MPPTVQVKSQRARAPAAVVAQRVTAYVPARVGAPQTARALAQAPLPSASNDIPGGSPTTV